MRKPAAAKIGAEPLPVRVVEAQVAWGRSRGRIGFRAGRSAGTRRASLLARQTAPNIANLMSQVDDLHRRQVARAAVAEQQRRNRGGIELWAEVLARGIKFLSVGSRTLRQER